MKTVFVFSTGSFATVILNQIITHPQIVDVALGCLLGVLFGLLCACVFVGPTEDKQTDNKKQEKTDSKPKTKRQPRKIIEQAGQIQHGLNVFNYQPTEWGIA